ncbi:hypothetical protein FLLO111716_09520 [Flavobacterium longum]|uniref:hypothetical protein n=1 Tax=Flavobacterium longum TaxID=1299340 RepID=UPI0039E92D18
MKHLYMLFLLTASLATAQGFELTPRGFEPVEIQRPNRPNEKLIDLTKAWADYYFKQQYDIYNVTANGLDIDVYKENGFFYHNLGELFSHRIKYTLKIEFLEASCRLRFTVREIYAKKTLLKMTPQDFFGPDGQLKDDMDEAKSSLEKTANNALTSYMKFIQG